MSLGIEELRKGKSVRIEGAENSSLLPPPSPQEWVSLQEVMLALGSSSELNLSHLCT